VIFVISNPNPLATLAVCYASEDEGFAPEGKGLDGNNVMDGDVLFDSNKAREEEILSSDGEF
jgi:hypothetical protein